MYRTLLEAARATADGQRALESVRAIAGHHRIQASPGYDDAAAWLIRQLEPLGCQVTVEHAAGDGRTRAFGQLLPEGWQCDRAEAWLIAGGSREKLCDFAAEPLSIVQRTAPARGRFPLVAVQDGSEPAHYEGRDVRGALVLTGAAMHRALDLAVRERGAAGLLSDGRRLFPPVRDRGHDPDSLAYTSFWWGGDEPRAFGMVVTPRRGEELRRRLAAGETLAVEVEIETQRGPRPIPLVSASWPGDGPDEVLVLAHLCHPKPGANDNASGAAALLETARVVSALQKDGRLGRLARGIRLLWMPELTGTFAWLAAEPDRVDRLVAALNLDMVGEDQSQCGSTLLIEHPPSFAASFAEELLVRIRAEAVEWVNSYSGPGHVPTQRLAEVPYSGGSDHAVLVDPTLGVPCPMLIQWPDRYYHSSYDTPDRCSPESLALAARIAATYAGALASAGAAELDALAAIVERGARRRLLAACDQPDADRAVTRERRRGARAIASLGRLGMPAADIDAALQSFEAFVLEHATNPSAPTSAPERGRVPERLKRGPFDFLDHLVLGYERLDRDARDAWRALRRRAPDPRLEIAWFACDGRRDVPTIAQLVAENAGDTAAADVLEFFELTVRLGVARWV